jgi:hypothetical protein
MLPDALVFFSKCVSFDIVTPPQTHTTNLPMRHSCYQQLARATIGLGGALSCGVGAMVLQSSQDAVFILVGCLLAVIGACAIAAAVIMFKHISDKDPLPRHVNPVPPTGGYVYLGGMDVAL